MHVNPRRTVSCHQRILHRTALQWNPYKITTCTLHSFLNCSRYFPCLATSHSNTTLAVTHDSQRRKPEQTTTLHYFRNAIDRYELLQEIIVACGALIACHRLQLPHRRCCLDGIPGENVVAGQNRKPASLAASANAFTRPWYLNPERSNATRSTPARFARSAMTRPTIAAAAQLPPYPTELRRSFSTVDALATVRSPSGDSTWT